MSPLKYPIRAPLSIKWSWKREVENLKEKASKLNETKKYLAYISLAIHKPINRRCFTCESDDCYKVYCRILRNARCRHNHAFTPILDGAGGAGGAGRPEFPPSFPKKWRLTKSRVPNSRHLLLINYNLFIYLFINELTWFIRSYMWARGKNDKCTSSGVSSGNPLWNWYEMKTYD